MTPEIRRYGSGDVGHVAGKSVANGQQNELTVNYQRDCLGLPVIFFTFCQQR